LAFADALINALNPKSYAGKILAVWPFFATNAYGFLVPIVDQYNKGISTNHGITNSQCVLATGLQGVLGTSFDTKYALSTLGGEGGAGMGLCIRTMTAGADQWTMGSNPSNGICGFALGTTHSVYTYWNTVPGAAPGAGAVGVHYMQRPPGASTTVRHTLDETELKTIASTAAADSTTIYVMGIQPAYTSEVQASYAFIADGGMSDADLTDFRTLCDTYIITPTGR
jgi:hypothetical protein